MSFSTPILVAGGESLAGAAIAARCRSLGMPVAVLSAADTDGWRDRAAVESAIRSVAPRFMVVAAGESGGIALNRAHPARLAESNLRVAANVLAPAAALRVPRLLYLASSCCYPRDARQPLRPESLGTGPFEPTNAPYSAAKSAAVAFCSAVAAEHGLAFFSAIPATVYGPEDHFDPDQAHVVTGLLRRMHEAKLSNAPSLSIWGTGAPLRDFIHSRDLADACLFLGREDVAPPALVNIGPGTAVSVAEVAEAVRQVVGYPGELVFDASKPDGAPVKYLDATPLREMGWSPSVPFLDGLRETYAAFLSRV